MTTPAQPDTDTLAATLAASVRTELLDYLAANPLPYGAPVLVHRDGDWQRGVLVGPAPMGLIGDTHPSSVASLVRLVGQPGPAVRVVNAALVAS